MWREFLSLFEEEIELPTVKNTFLFDLSDMSMTNDCQNNNYSKKLITI